MKKNVMGWTLAVALAGCINSSDENTTKIVEVYSAAPVMRAVVKDASGQIAQQADLGVNRYRFSKTILYPISVQANGSDSYIDLDFDGTRSASDAIFSDTLYSVTPVVTLVTTALLEHADVNSSRGDYNVSAYRQERDAYAHAFSIAASELESKTPLQSNSRNLSSLSDTIFYERVSGDFNASDTDAMMATFNRMSNFHNEYLYTRSDESAVKYSAFYHALELIESKLLSRANPNFMPSIPAFMNTEYASEIANLPSDSLLSSEYNDASNLAYWAIANDEANTIAYVAAGNDGFDVVETSTPSARLDNRDDNSSGFGTSIRYMDRDDARCIFLADQENQVSIAGVWPLSNVTYENGASSYLGNYRSATSGAKSFDIDFASTNAGNLEYLLISNGPAGLEIVDATSLTCKSAVELNASHRFNATAIGSDTHSAVMASNRKIVYAADGAAGIIAVDISGSAPTVLGTTALYNTQSAYNLEMVANSNELYVSTDEGVQIYNTDNSGAIVFRSFMPTEGSRANTLGETLRVSASANNRALFVADITGGIKVFDVSDSANPKLCGAAYFSAANLAERSAVRDVYLQEHTDGRKTLYIANDSNGLIQLDDASDLLFDHCKSLLEL